MRIELYLDIPDTVTPILTLLINNIKIKNTHNNEKNKHGHYLWEFDVVALDENLLTLHVEGLGDIMDKTKYLRIVDIIIDEVNFDVVHQMNCRTQPLGLEYQKGSTQLDNDGYFEIPFNTPVWEHWCKTFNNFDIVDYPLWS